RDEMNRKTAPGRDSAAPSSPAPVANRITATESPTKKACNGLLQQNLPISDIRSAAKLVLLNDLVGAHKQRWRHIESERFCGLEVEDRLVLGRCLHRKVGGLGATQNTVDIGRRLPKLVDNVSAVRHQTELGHMPTDCIRQHRSLTN